MLQIDADSSDVSTLQDSPRSVRGLSKYLLMAVVTTVRTGLDGCLGLTSCSMLGATRALTTNLIFFVGGLNLIVRRILSTTTFFGVSNKFVIS